MSKVAVGLVLVLSLPVAVGAALAQGETAAALREDRAAPAHEPAARHWMFTETASPLDYSPVVIASAWSSEGDSPVVQLSIQCRRGRTELVIASPAMKGRPEDHRISYSINDAPPVAVPAGAAALANGIAVKDDAVRLLTGLPAEGEIAFEITNQDAPLKGRYALAPIKTMLDRLAGPCQWPGKPH
jgi:hypothetical protein